MSQTRSLQAVSSACVLLSLAACSGLGNEGDARSLVARGRFEEAVRVAAAEVERNPDSAQAQADHRDATIAYLLEEGRQQTFRDEDDAALVTFARALEVDPSNKCRGRDRRGVGGV